MLAKLTGWMLLGVVRLLTGAQARWYGCPPKAEQRIYFANHQSHADLVMIWAALPEELRTITRPIAARDYWGNTPLKRWITTEVFNAVYVERGGAPVVPLSTPSTPRTSQPHAVPTLIPSERIEPSMDPIQPFMIQVPPPAPAAFAVKAVQLPLISSAAIEPAPSASDANATPAPDTADPLAPLIEALTSGDSIIIFPEGTRGYTGEPQKFKSGLFTLAQMFPDVVLVPAWIDNIQRVMPKGEVVPVPILCSVTFGAPIRLEEGEERRPFLDRARDAVVALRNV